MTKKIQLIVFFIIIFVGVYILNFFFPMTGDDFSYSFIFGTQERIKNLSDILKSQYTYYFAWGGRVLAHFLVQLFLLFPKYIFDFFNSLMFILMLIGIYLNLDDNIKKKYNKINVFILIIFLVWFIFPRIGETIFWLTGSLNYLWMGTLCLYFVYVFKKISNQKNKLFTNKILIFIFYLLLFILGFFSGCTNENMGISIFAAAIIYLIANKIVKTEIIFLLLGLLLGSIFLNIAPGNFTRAGESFIINIITKQLERKFLFLIVFSSFFSYVIFGKQKICEKFRRYFFELLITFFALGFMIIFSPQFPIRARTGGILFLIVFIINILLEIDITKKIKNLKNYFFIIFYMIIFIMIFSSYFSTFKNYKIVFNEMIERNKIISKSGSQLVIPSLTKMNKRTMYLDEPVIDSNNWLNIVVRNYYKKEKIVTIFRDTYFNIYLPILNKSDVSEKYSSKSKNSFVENIYSTNANDGMYGNKKVFFLQLNKNIKLSNIKSVNIKFAPANSNELKKFEVAKTDWLEINENIFFMKDFSLDFGNYNNLVIETKLLNGHISETIFFIK
ncbi:MAG: DUF3329 domain-containing protein [Fusobacteriaceae bacterium]